MRQRNTTRVCESLIAWLAGKKDEETKKPPNYIHARRMTNNGCGCNLSEHSSVIFQTGVILMLLVGHMSDVMESFFSHWGLAGMLVRDLMNLIF